MTKLMLFKLATAIAAFTICSLLNGCGSVRPQTGGERYYMKHHMDWGLYSLHSVDWAESARLERIKHDPNFVYRERVEPLW